MAAASAEDRILAAIRAVPRGEVAGYGHIARRAGLPGRARLVARVLANNDDQNLPWHRVLRSDGRIAFPEGSRGWREQSQRLRAEGVVVERGRVRMPKADASLDAMIWGEAMRSRAEDTCGRGGSRIAARPAVDGRAGNLEASDAASGTAKGGRSRQVAMRRHKP